MYKYEKEWSKYNSVDSCYRKKDFFESFINFSP